MKIKDIQAVYVINLARRDDRWEQLQSAWKRTLMPQELIRFRACDGRDFIPPKSWDVGNAAFGCYLSHVGVLTEIVKFGLDNVLVLEDDAYFVDGFRDKLALVLADLPPIYDALYLGWQALHTDRVPPSKITEHLGRAGNNNRTHGTMYSNRGAKRLLQHFHDLSERKKKDHIDHWAGRLHEALDKAGEHVFDIYNALPQLIYQGAGNSDICGKATPLNTWLYNGPYKTEQPKVFYVTSFSTGYGDIGKNGALGYESKKVDLPNHAYLSTLSLHAPSKAAVTLSERLFVVGYMNPSGGPGEAVDVIVDGVVIGQIKAPGTMTKQIKLEPGEHTLEFSIPDKHKGLAHSVWVFNRADHQR